MRIFLLLLICSLFSISTFAETVGGDDSSGSRQSRSSKKSAGGKGAFTISINLGSSTLSAPGMGSVKIGYGSVAKYGKGAHTPKGTFRAGKLGDWLTNKKYNGKRVLLRSAIQITGGILMHEGRGVGPVSHGCIRVPPGFMKQLLAKARRAGAKNVTIKIT